ncbi:NADH dehydrogenase [ubiquinone] 1 alpha subcomplex assembly factor 2 isoform X7 [Equus asinus]|uniref:NADH dehydrogenase [ubiquinone] 1 alpha subcomplex assembly factor 2 isoform X7 n=1 Tax=Equus asinus TaxID=9793 RepID=UPI0038F5EFDA
MGGAGGWGVPARVAADRAVTGAGSWAAGMGWSQDLFRALCRALSKDVKEQVGTDRFGNKYYCIPEYKNWRGHTVRERRIVEAANKREVDYEVGDIPTEWEAWIRRTRKTPPTMEVRIHKENIQIACVYNAPFYFHKTHGLGLLLTRNLIISSIYIHAGNTKE